MVIASVVVKGAEIVMHAGKVYLKQITAYKLTHSPLHAKNSTSLTANWKLLLNLYISNFLVLKLTLMLTFLRPAGSPPGGTAVTSTLGEFVVGAFQTLKSSGTA